MRFLTRSLMPIRSRLLPLTLPAMTGAFDAPPQFVRRIGRHARGGAIVSREPLRYRLLPLPPSL
jgi:hypothetical protein